MSFLYFRNMRNYTLPILLAFLLFTSSAYGMDASKSTTEPVVSSDSDITAWWVYPIILFVVCIIIGVVAVLAGVGGGVLFVPVVSGFFPFHFDFVRGAGLFLALSMSLSAGPNLLRKGLADLRLALPVALVTSIGTIIGARASLSIPSNILQSALGVVILGIVIFMLLSKNSSYPQIAQAKGLSGILNIGGKYHEPSEDRHIDWATHRMARSLLMFIGIGFMAGMFGLGAGWANVPVLNFVLGVPLKLAVGTSGFMISATAGSGAWIYLNEGAVLPIIVVPSIAGMMIGSRIGAKILPKCHPTSLRYIVIVVLALAGLRSILKGFGI